MNGSLITTKHKKWEREYTDNVFDEQNGFKDKILCEMFSLKESDHDSENYNLDGIRNIFSSLGMKMFIPKDFDLFIKNKTYAYLVEILSDNKNVRKVLDMLEIKCFTWFVEEDSENSISPIIGDKAKNYRELNKKNKNRKDEPTDIREILITITSNPGKLFAVDIRNFDSKTMEMLNDGYIISIIYADGVMHVIDSNVIPDLNYFKWVERIAKCPVKVEGNYDNLLYNLLYNSEGALQASDSKKYFESFGNCQSWQQIIMLIYLSNPTTKPKVIISLLLALGDGAKILLMNHWYYVYSYNLFALSLSPTLNRLYDEIYKLLDEIIQEPTTTHACKAMIQNIRFDLHILNRVMLKTIINGSGDDTKRQMIEFFKKHNACYFL